MTTMRPENVRNASTKIHRKSKRPCWRLSMKGFLIFMLVVVYVNYFRSSVPAATYSNNSNAILSTSSLKGLKGLAPFYYEPKKQLGPAQTNAGKQKRSLQQPYSHPPIVKGMSRVQTLVQQWNKWASHPITESWAFQTKATQPGDRPTKTVHFPSADLEDVLEKNKHSKSNIVIPPIQQSTRDDDDTDIVVLTRKGNKFSQGELPADDTVDTIEQQLGVHRQPNQDRILVLKNNYHDNNSNIQTKDDFWMGLFDGHGSYGHCISHYCSLEFAKRIADAWDHDGDRNNNNTPDAVKAQLKSTFLSINDSMPRLFGSGTTAISIWKRSNMLYISNVGDSVAFVASFEKTNPKNVQIIYQTKPHKPDNPEERARIEAAGGHVEDAPFEGASARLLIPMPDGISVFGLAMSRSLGDHDGLAIGLSAEPTTDVLDLSSKQQQFDFNTNEYFVVAATDGMIDHGRLTAMEVAQRMAQAFATGKPNAPVEAAQELIMKSSQMWADDVMMQGYRDDQSIAVCKLQL